ncbi:MAG: DUF433 domain-containing protein [Phycisphaerae bacterium]
MHDTPDNDVSEPTIRRVPGVLGGKPMIRQTRISVELILESLAAGRTQESILQSYPFLTPDDLAAAVLYAKEHLPGSTEPADVTGAAT